MNDVDERASHAFAHGWPDTERQQALARFRQVAPRLEACLERLYGEAGGYRDWLIELYRRIGHRAGQRPAELKALDRRREAQPDWFIRDRLVGYAAYADRFGGDLRGVTGRIPYLRSLGVGYLHLLPFLRSRAGENDGGFAVASFEEIEPALGDMHDLRTLTAALREAGISLCADFVLNHVADDHPWARAARAGDAHYRRWFHVVEDRAGVDAYEATVSQVFPEVAPGNFTRVESMRGWVWTTFYPYQWDLNYAEPDVFAAMADALLHLANQGVEVFRLDSAPYLWKRMGGTCLNEPEVHQVLGALRAVVELAAPGCVLKAEAITSIDQLMPYFGTGELRGRECHLAYRCNLMASAWVSLVEGSAEWLRTLLASMHDLPPHTGWLTYVRCHDDIVWGVLEPEMAGAGYDYAQRIGEVARRVEGRSPLSFGRGAPFQYGEGDTPHGSNGMTASLLGLPDDPDAEPDAHALARLALMYGLMFWIGTVPMIYMGDELGQVNNASPADAARLAADGRWLQRPVLDEARLRRATEGKGVPAAVRARFEALRLARLQLPLVGEVTPTVVAENEPALLTLTRGEHEMAWFNLGGEPLRVGDPGPAWRTVYEGLDADGILPPWGMHWSVRA